MDRVEHPLRLERRREEDVGEADGRVQVLAVVVVLVAALVVLVGVVGAERDAGEVALLLGLRGGRGGFLRERRRGSLRPAPRKVKQN